MFDISNNVQCSSIIRRMTWYATDKMSTQPLLLCFTHVSALSSKREDKSFRIMSHNNLTEHSLTAIFKVTSWSKM